jgi:hypothetical protein
MRSDKLNLPIQCQPVPRALVSQVTAADTQAGGVQPSQIDACGNLRGLAQQMCYATQYGVSI